MQTGCTSGANSSMLSVDIFSDDKRGYSSVAVALALLLSVSLVFSLAQAQWLLSRGADIQDVADATALAGSNVVGSYTSVVHILDACVLSLGLTGLAVSASGLVMLCIPGAQAAGEEIFSQGIDLLEQRQRFAQSAYRGLEHVEAALPGVIAAHASVVAQANSSSHVSYSGVALPLPLASASEFPNYEEDFELDTLQEAADKLGDASRKAEKAAKQADDALMRGWLADCGNQPYCMRQRAQTLASLSDAQNPNYPSPEGWNFGAAIKRARAYYAKRIQIEGPVDAGIESVTDSCARMAFFEYALEQVRAANYYEQSDGTVELYLPELPRNASEIRETHLYTDIRWPTSLEETGPVLHSTLACPGARGAAADFASLADQEAGLVGHCDICRMDIGDLGKTPAASTNIENGFEHWWRELVRAANNYKQANNERVEAEKAMREAGEQGKDAFAKALDVLLSTRPKLCPAGAWGTIALVARPDALVTPETLVGAFTSQVALPEGVAMAAAALAPDTATADNNSIASFLDGLIARGAPSVIEALDSLLTLWGKLLLSYNSFENTTTQTAEAFLDNVDGLFGGSVGAWLKNQLQDVIHKAGLEPVDIRLIKPVLVGSWEVFSQAGYSEAVYVQGLVNSLTGGVSPIDVVRAAGISLAEGIGILTIAELPIPGTPLTIPLTIDLSSLVDAL